MRLNRFLREAATITTILVACTSAGTAHEFWISPEAGKVMPGDTVKADLKVGLMLKGEPYPYLSNRFRSFNVTVNQKRQAVQGTQGDLPALANVTAQAGLNVITHQTTAFRANHDDWKTFQRYLKEEGLSEFEPIHTERGLPKKGFAERYTRYAKALVQAGPVRANDKDLATGMAFELTARVNPYAAGVTQLPVMLTWQGKPVSGRQINVFHETDGSVKRISVVTNAKGEAIVSIAGAGEYLLNAVHLTPADSPPVTWESHWAALSFKL